MKKEWKEYAKSTANALEKETERDRMNTRKKINRTENIVSEFAYYLKQYLRKFAEARRDIKVKTKGLVAK